MKNNTNSPVTYFSSDLIFLDKGFIDSADFFDFAFDQLKAKGYVKDSFLAAIKNREQAWPTALPTQPDAIALPHTDIEHVIKPFISVTRLSNPIGWYEMGNDENLLQVRFIFLLGFTDKNGHIDLLQSLIEYFNDPEFIKLLNNATTAENVINILIEKINI